MRGFRLNILLFLILPVVLFAQVQSGTIVGTVTDPGGAVIPGVQVTVVNEGTSFQRAVETNASGQFVAYSVPTGMYSITVEAEGFQRLERSGVQLMATATVDVNLEMTIGSIAETVEVVGAAPLLETQDATISNLVENEEIINLPLNGRSFTQACHSGARDGNGIQRQPELLRVCHAGSRQHHGQRVDGAE